MPGAQYLLNRLKSGESLDTVFPQQEDVEEIGFNLLKTSDELSETHSEELKDIIQTAIQMANEQPNHPQKISTSKNHAVMKEESQAYHLLKNS